MAVIWEGEQREIRQLTYAELHTETSRLSNALKRLGVARGDAVGVFLPLVPEAVIAFLACARIGAIAVPIFSGFGAQAVRARLEDARATVLITADTSFRRGKAIAMEQVATEAVLDSSSIRHVIVARNGRGGESLPRANGHLDWNDLLAGESSECSSESLDPESPLLIAYTSGTTGVPKGAVHVHGGFLVKIAQEVAHQVDMRRRPIVLGDRPWLDHGALGAGGGARRGWDNRPP